MVWGAGVAGHMRDTDSTNQTKPNQTNQTKPTKPNQTKPEIPKQPQNPTIPNQTNPTNLAGKPPRQILSRLGALHLAGRKLEEFGPRPPAAFAVGDAKRRDALRAAAGGAWGAAQDWGLLAGLRAHGGGFWGLVVGGGERL